MEEKERRVEMLTLRETSERTRLSYDALRKMCLRNEIVHIRVGSKFLVNFDKLIEYLQDAHG